MDANMFSYDNTAKFDIFYTILSILFIIYTNTILLVIHQFCIVSI